jgi:hypothetical protein
MFNSEIFSTNYLGEITLRMVLAFTDAIAISANKNKVVILFISANFLSESFFYLVFLFLKFIDSFLFISIDQFLKLDKTQYKTPRVFFFSFISKLIDFK